MLWKPMVSTTHTLNSGSIALRATWYMDYASNDTLVLIYENALSSSDYHTT